MKRFVCILITFSMAFSMFALGQGEKKLESLTIKAAVLKGPTGVGMIQLFDKKPVLRDNAVLETLALASVDLMVAKLATGEVDIAALPPNTAAKLFNSGLEYSLGAVVGRGMLSLISSDTSVKTLADLKGKEVYVSGQGAIPEYLVRYILNKAGIDTEKDVKLLFNMPYPEMAQSLIAGKIKYAILPEPFATMALKGKNDLLVSIDIQNEYAKYAGFDNYPISVIVVKNSLLKERPNAVADFFASYKASIAFVNANPKEAGLLVEKYELGLKAPIAEASIPRSNFVFMTAKEAKAELEAVFNLLLSFAPESIGKKLPDSQFYAF